MNAISEYVHAKDVDPSGHYSCPLCKVQTTSDKADTGWVFCPMVRNMPICLGCCLNYQSVARADDFDDHPFRGIFDDVFQLTGNDVITQRQTCLEHQESIVCGELAGSIDEQTRKGLLLLLSQIRTAKGKVGRKKREEKRGPL